MKILGGIYMEKSYEELQEELDDLMEKIDESMTMTRKQQKDLDKMEKAMMNESKPMKLESRKVEFTEKGQYKTEFDEMTKNALINAQKNIIVLREQTEKAYQDMLMKTVRKQKAIEEKLESMRDRDLTPEKLELVENSARKAREAVNTEMFEFQKKHFEQRATLDNYEDSIKKYALELGVEKELNEINPKQVIEEFNETKNKAEKPETEKAETEKTEQDKPEQDKPEQDKPEQNKPEQDKPEQDKPETEKPASGNPVPGAPTPGKTGANEIEEIVLENNAEEFSRNCSLEEFKKEIFEDVDFVKAIFETEEATPEEKDEVIEAMYEHPKMDRRLLYKLTHDKNANPIDEYKLNNAVASNVLAMNDGKNTFALSIYFSDSARRYYGAITFEIINNKISVKNEYVNNDDKLMYQGHCIFFNEKLYCFDIYDNENDMNISMFSYAY